MPPAGTGTWKFTTIYIVWSFRSEQNHLIKIRINDTCWASSQLLLCCLDMKTNFTSLNKKIISSPEVAHLLGRNLKLSLSCLKHEAAWHYGLSAQNPYLHVFSVPACPVFRTQQKHVCQNSPCAMLPFGSDFGMKSPLFLNPIKIEELLKLFLFLPKNAEMHTFFLSELGFRTLV